MKWICFSNFLFLCKCPKKFGRLSHQISFSVTCERERGNERGEREGVWKEREGEMVTQNTQEASSVIINIAVGAKKCFEKRQFSWRSYFVTKIVKLWVLFCQLNFNFYFICPPNIFFSRSVSLTFFWRHLHFLFFSLFCRTKLDVRFTWSLFRWHPYKTWSKNDRNSFYRKNWSKSESAKNMFMQVAIDKKRICPFCKILSFLIVSNSLLSFLPRSFVLCSPSFGLKSGKI